MKEIELTKEQRQAAVASIKNYFLNEREEEITELAATLLLDFIIKNIGPLLYNQALKDAHYFLMEKLDDLYTLERPLPGKR